MIDRYMQILCRYIELTDRIAQKTIRKKKKSSSPHHISSSWYGNFCSISPPRPKAAIKTHCYSQKFTIARVYLHHFAQSCSYTTTTLNIQLKGCHATENPRRKSYHRNRKLKSTSDTKKSSKNLARNQR